MQTISVNFIVPQGWHELSDKQLRYFYQLIADNFATDFAGKKSKPCVCSVGAAQKS